ncbi:asparagine synthetase B [Okeania sp. SIO2B3]|uniref:asparagine synthetase B family protein n=1 Tax=Okeania sp. SIO2B3 TaxID=2607784 RepID=UPI0013C11FEC|nr:asparagine synthetase B family protein [Okeania sp. SIO2B3]NET44786.1 asparagine synthase [Okeania sp. SIO2B3]
MKFNFLSLNRQSSVPTNKNLVTPSWHLTWGKIDQIKADISWSDRHFLIHQFQPTFSSNERFVVVGDICLTNLSQLQKNLDISATLTATQIVAELWQSYGKKTFLLLEGIFALAVWDREEKELWIGRDRVGGRTLYYTTKESTIWISPRLKVLSSYHSNELDLIALRDYLCCAFVPGERTLWQEVKELRPGSFIRFTNDLKIPSPMSYWQPQVQVKNADRPLEYHGEKLRSLLDTIIPEYLPNNQPVGAYLSGGLDSSCIVALAAKNHGYPVHTYSIHFGAELPNELEFSSLVAQHCQTQHHILEITPDDMWNKLPITMANLDDPIGDPLTVPNYLLGNLAAENVEVILNGEGGDPCFGGPKNKPMLLNNIYGVLQSGKPDIVSSYLSSFHKCFADLSKLLKPEIWEAVKTEPYVFESDLNSDADYLNRLMLLNIKFKGADHILTKVNNMTRAASLIGLSPLFDQRIVELSLEIPPEYKLSGADEKAVLKRAVADLLPEIILTRPKSGMMVPVNFWFRQIWQRRTRNLLLSKNAAIAPYFNQDLIKDWLNYRGDTWRRYGIQLWLLVSLEIWLQVNL